MDQHFVKLSEEEFIKEVLDLLNKANEKNLCLRVLGGLAVYLHVQDKPESLALLKTIGRLGEGNPLFTDLDLIAYSKQRKEITKFFSSLGFKQTGMLNALFGDRRMIFYHPQNKYQVDIFFDKLEFSHDVNFGDKPGSGRLELDFPTISLEDLVLEKLQIHEINRKDLVDLALLFIFHEVSNEQKKDSINASYIAKILADDWGFWYDAMNNLNKLKNLIIELVKEGKLKEEIASMALSRIDNLIERIEKEPKTKKWLKRAKIGTKKPWYRDVEEVVR